MQGRRGEMGYEEGELELEDGEAASGGRELVVPDALTYIGFLAYQFNRICVGDTTTTKESLVQASWVRLTET